MSPSSGANRSLTKSIAARPNVPPVGGTRNVSSPRSEASVSIPTAPVSQNSMPRPAAASDAGAEIVLP